jgi:hypothetical protein
MELAGGLVTDQQRTLQNLAIAPTQHADFETTIPQLSLCTFVWTQNKIPSLTLPKDILLR